MAPQAQNRPHEAVPLSKWTVLIVDDEQPILDLLQSVLEDAGYTVLTACDGGAALRLAHRRKPDLVLTDVMMPHVDGVALCAHLHGDPDTSQIPVIGMSAAPRIGAEADFTEMLAKPFDLAEVLRHVDATLSLA